MSWFCCFDLKIPGGFSRVSSLFLSGNIHSGETKLKFYVQTHNGRKHFIRLKCLGKPFQGLHAPWLQMNEISPPLKMNFRFHISSKTKERARTIRFGMIDVSLCRQITAWGIDCPHCAWHGCCCWRDENFEKVGKHIYFLWQCMCVCVGCGWVTTLSKSGGSW